MNMIRTMTINHTRPHQVYLLNDVFLFGRLIYKHKSVTAQFDNQTRDLKNTQIKYDMKSVADITKAKRTH